MATIGRSKAVMQSGPIKVSGFIAWVAWLFVHILYLVGFRNRMLVLSTVGLVLFHLSSEAPA